LVTCLAGYGWPVGEVANDTPLSKGVQHVMGIAFVRVAYQACSTAFATVMQQVLF